MIFLADDSKKGLNKTKDKEGNTMAVAKPNTRAFTLREDKVEQFMKKNDTSKKTLERFRAHKPKNGVVTPTKGRNV